MKSRKHFYSILKTHINRCLMTILLSGLWMVGTAQVSGTVVDAASDEPLIGASVLISGSTDGTITDIDGRFTLATAKAGDVLTVSYLGYTSVDVTVGAESDIQISLSQGVALDEIVVTGYATQTRGDITGSVASVDMLEAVKTPLVNAAEALQGRVTGVQVVTNGNPGDAPKINIRGFGTSNNTNPLFIIDGLQTDDPNALNYINPDDIDQMNVLKDGAAAIYGARAANGVVIVTTKGGGYNMDKPVVNFNIYTGSATLTSSPGLLNAQQHADMIFASQENNGETPSHPQYGDGTFTVPNNIVGYTRVTSYNPIVFAPAGQFNATVTPGGTDWIDAITQDAPLTNISFSVANGEKSGKYYLAANYLTRDGLLNHTGFNRGNVKVNSEYKVGSKIKVGQHFNMSYTKSNSGTDEAIEGALRMTPLLPVMDDDGEFAGVAGPGLSNTRNPVAQLYRARNNFNKRFNLLGDVYASVELMDGLTAKSVIAGGYGTLDTRAFTALDPEHGEPIGTNTLNEQNQTSFNWNWTNTLNYVKTFGDHYINGIVGVEALEENSKGFGVSRQGYLFEVPEFYLLSNGSGTPNVDYAFEGASSLYSLFASANYNFQEKYYVTATIRRDESSRFSGDNKSDIFPSFSVGWDISKESFFPQGGFFDRVKFKGSWGQLGNQTLPANNPTINISNLNESLANYAFDGSTVVTGALLSQVGNPNLKWETSVTTNFGVDLSMLDHKFQVTLEYFNIKTQDLITRDFSLISSTAIDAGAPLVNLGDIRNTGVDFSIGYGDRTSSGFGYDVSLNLSHYKNEVLSLINDAPVAGRGDLRNGAVTRTEVGEELSYFYGRQITGFDESGRFTYADINEDGVIDDLDRTKIGSPHPDFTYGINIKLDYKGFDLSAFFTGSQGNDIYNYNKVFTDFGLFFNGNRSDRVLDAWTPSNTDTEIPALTTSYPLEEASSNTYFIEDGSYFRLRNLQVGYTLPTSLTDKAGMESLRFYIQGTNLFTVTNYQGFDPEIISYDNLSLGIDRRIYPMQKVITFGANIRF
ncbi:MAG: TonB-dependent receptor [Bacteroidota bacterium]